MGNSSCKSKPSASSGELELLRPRPRRFPAGAARTCGSIGHPPAAAQHDDAPRHTSSRRRRIRPSSARPQGHLLHGDVGALQLLRHARPARAVPGPGARLCAGRRAGAVRHLYRARLSDAAAGRLPRRPLPRHPGERGDRRQRHDARPLRDGLPLPAAYRARPADRRQRLLQAEHLVDGRHALPRPRPAPRRRLHDFLHGHQPRRLLLAAGRRDAGREVRLALGLRVRRRRHGHRLVHPAALADAARRCRLAAGPGALGAARLAAHRRRCGRRRAVRHARHRPMGPPRGRSRAAAAAGAARARPGRHRRRRLAAGAFRQAECS